MWFVMWFAFIIGNKIFFLKINISLNYVLPIDGRNVGRCFYG